MSIGQLQLYITLAKVLVLLTMTMAETSADDDINQGLYLENIDNVDGTDEQQLDELTTVVPDPSGSPYGDGTVGVVYSESAVDLLKQKKTQRGAQYDAYQYAGNFLGGDIC